MQERPASTCTILPAGWTSMTCLKMSATCSDTIARQELPQCEDGRAAVRDRAAARFRSDWQSLCRAVLGCLCHVMRKPLNAGNPPRLEANEGRSADSK